MLGQFKVIAGDFKIDSTNSQLVIKGKSGKKSVLYMNVPRKLFSKKYKVSDIEVLEIASEESIQRAGGQAAWAIGGALLTGGVGLLAGAVLGRKREIITFICKFSDGKKFVGEMKAKDFSSLSSAYGKNESLLDNI